jgi:phosphatidylglycerophosphatase A
MKLIASIFGIGYIRKGGGTVAAAFAVLIWWLLFRNEMSLTAALVLTAGTTLLGVWSGNVVESEWGKDSYRVVIDEVAGMFISLLLVPVSWPWMLTSFVLFRFFDIAKPLYVRKMEMLKGGWGVMMDDVLAGVYANVVVQLLLLCFNA